MVRKKNILFIASSLSILLILYSCARPSTEKTITIVGDTVADGVSINEGSNFFSNSLEDLLFSPLISSKTTFEGEKILLDRAVPVEDGRVWDISIKENVRFHSSAPLTADDVVFSIDKRREFSERLAAVKNARALDRKSIRLTLDRPYKDISLILMNVYVYPKVIFREGGNWRQTLLRNPVGSGPFRFGKWIKNGCELRANKDYFEGRPRIDKLIYTYENSEKKKLAYLLKGKAHAFISFSTSTAGFLEEDDRYSVKKLISPYFTAVFLNNELPLFKDKTVRRALSMAIDRNAIVDKTLQGSGTVAFGPFVKEMLPNGYEPEDAKYDPKRAAQLLRDAGWKDLDGDRVLEKNGERLRIDLYYISGNDSFRNVADKISRYLYEIGIEVECIPISFNDFTERRFSERYDAVLADVTPFFPEILWSERFYKDRRGLNLSNYRSGKAEIILDKLREATSPEEVRERNAELDRLIRDDSPALFLYNTFDYSAVSRRITGVGKSICTPYDFYNIKNWDISE